MHPFQIIAACAVLIQLFSTGSLSQSSRRNPVGLERGRAFIARDEACRISKSLLRSLDVNVDEGYIYTDSVPSLPTDAARNRSTKFDPNESTCFSRAAAAVGGKAYWLCGFNIPDALDGSSHIWIDAVTSDILYYCSDGPGLVIERSWDSVLTWSYWADHLLLRDSLRKQNILHWTYPLRVPRIKVYELTLSEDEMVDSPPRPSAGYEELLKTVAFPSYGQADSIIVRATIDSLGRPSEIHAISNNRSRSEDSVRSGLMDWPAEDIVKRASFTPARLGGRAVSVSVNIPIVFQLGSKNSIAFSPVIGFSEISLERSSCCGGCPEYRITLRDDGSGSYEGIANVEKLGVYIGKLTTADYRNIEAVVNWMNFFELPNLVDEYVETPQFILTAKQLDGKTKRIVSNYPFELTWGLAKLIDGVASAIIWNRGSKGR
jgi:hypothetical protein